ncbi:MAG TPA: 2-dehydropantoate 2-reductase [Xanthobacteraceae bacterium]|nr:2-dehydropantoate 2-reductase [Xanthobacteraceae bacterium]
MRIAVMAAGAVGGYFGARLAAAGREVHFIARGAQLEALRRNGLKIESPLGDLHLKDVRATDDPKRVGPVDIVLFAVKLWDTEQAAELTRPLIGAETRLITFQNGVDSVERIAPILGADKVLGGTAHIATVVAAPGVIRHTSAFARLRAGRIDGRPDAMLARFVEAGQAASIDIAASAEINADRWKKFVFLAALAGATGATRQPLGAILADADTRALFVALMREVIAVSAARGVALPQDFLDEQIKFAENAPKSMKASLLHDLERGNRLELDWLTGAVTRLGRELNVPTPTNDAVYAVLKLHRMGARSHDSP